MTRAEAEALLYREARLLDERRFDEWLAMFANDCLYWIPTAEEDPATEPSLIYDDRARLVERVYRLTETKAYAQRPRSRTQQPRTRPSTGRTGGKRTRCHGILPEPALRRAREQSSPWARPSRLRSRPSEGRTKP